jgi:hypothetical protein
MMNNLKISISIVCSSYAEFPFHFEVILGVTGTLWSLPEKQLEILKSVYRIEKYNYIPPVYGDNKLQFSSGTAVGKLMCWI